MTSEDVAQLTDRELVARAADPHTRALALEAIYARYGQSTLRFVASQLRESDSALDAAQDTFAELIAYFGAGKTLNTPDQLPAFIRTIALRRTMAYMRGGSPGRGHKPSMDLLAVGDLPDVGAEAQDIVRAEEELGLARVRRLLDTQIVPTLTDRQQQIYEYSVRRQLTGQALAQALGLTAGQAKNNAEHV